MSHHPCNGRCTDETHLDIRQRLEFLGNQLDLFIVQFQAQLLHTVLDRVPSGKPVSDGHVAGHSKVGRVQDFVGGRVVEDGLGVDAGLVREGAVAGDCER